MLFDEVDRYYVPDCGNYWQQGDIVLAPGATFDGGYDRAGELLDAPPPGEPRRRRIWAPEDGSVSGLVANAVLSPAIVTTHDCTLDKEFIRRFHELRREQVPVEEARRLAAAEPLDEYLTVAPIVPPADAAPTGLQELFRNQVVGYFPVCESEHRAIDLGVVNLLRETTIHRDLIVERLGVLSPTAVGAFRYALARFWVYRAPKLTFDLERAIGQTIQDARISTEDPLALELDLSDGETLRLLQAPPANAGGPERPGLPEP